LAPASNWPLNFTLPSKIQPLTVSNFSFQGLNLIFGDPSQVIPWTYSYTLKPSVNCKPCKQKGDAGTPLASGISVENASLSEDLPVAGTEFTMHYESGRAPGAGGDARSSNDASMIGGWTLDVHHAYDPTTNTLFLGDGHQRNGLELGTPVLFNGNLLVTSEDGSEVYVISLLTGLHVQTLRPLTGALLYKFGYDAVGKLITVTDANGNVTTIQRNTAEQPVAIVSPFGQTTTLAVDSHGFLSNVTDPLGKSASFVNSPTGLLTSRTDQNGNIFNYTYDSNGRLIKDADPLGGFVALTRTAATSGFGWTVGETTSMGRTSSYETILNLPWVQDGTSPESEQHTNTWPNGLHAASSSTLLNGQLSESYTLPDGTSDSSTSGPDPRWGIQVPVLTSETLKQGSLTLSTTGSRTATLATPGNPFTLVSQTDKQTINGRTYTSAFTTSNRTFVDTSPAGRKITTVLDSQERLASFRIAGLLAGSFAYDSRGRLSSITQGVRKYTFAYDSDGRLATAADPLGLKTAFQYDADGRLLGATLPDGRIVVYQHDGNGNLTAVVPPGKSAHDFAYTAVDQMSGYIPPTVVGTGATTYSYNLDRDIMKITRPDGRAITFDYDSGGRLSSLVTPTETVNYTYSSTTGNLTSASITSGEALSYTYNGPLPTGTTWTGNVQGSVTLAYNNNFQVTSERINNGAAISFTYDNDGLLTKAGALTFNRDSQNGFITGSTMGLAGDSLTYNGFGELIGYTASASGTTLYNVAYTRDNDGRVSSETESIAGTVNKYGYTYDLAGRITGVSKNGTAVSTYTYDTNSNRLKAVTPSGIASATYDAQDRLLTYGTAIYTYTANGELATQSVGLQKTTYQYDILGNLVDVTLPSGKVITYVVDAEERRVGKKVNGALVEGFLYDGDRIIAQVNASNQVASEFIYGTGSTSPDFMVSGGATYRIISDQLGSPRLVVNTTTGAIVEQINYDEFGNVLKDTNPGFQPFGFAGGLYDQDTKLVRFGARDYNASVGRWTAKDPILLNGGDTNLYGYVLQDPVNLIDPAGLCGVCRQTDAQKKPPLRLKKGDPIPYKDYTPSAPEGDVQLASGYVIYWNRAFEPRNPGHVTRFSKPSKPESTSCSRSYKYTHIDNCPGPHGWTTCSHPNAWVRLDGQKSYPVGSNQRW
jgi:RHS repeat-associated protein